MHDTTVQIYHYTVRSLFVGGTLESYVYISGPLSLQISWVQHVSQGVEHAILHLYTIIVSIYIYTLYIMMIEGDKNRRPELPLSIHTSKLFYIPIYRITSRALLNR